MFDSQIIQVFFRKHVKSCQDIERPYVLEIGTRPREAHLLSRRIQLCSMDTSLLTNHWENILISYLLDVSLLCRRFQLFVHHSRLVKLDLCCLFQYRNSSILLFRIYLGKSRK